MFLSLCVQALLILISNLTGLGESYSKRSMGMLVGDIGGVVMFIYTCLSTIVIVKVRADCIHCHCQGSR